MELSFNSSRIDHPFVERTIAVASGLMYNIICTTTEGNLDDNSWFRESRVVTLDTAEGIYSQSRNSYTWILVFTNFSSGDTGRYSCSYSGETRILNIITGEWMGVGSRNKTIMQYTNCYTRYTIGLVFRSSTDELSME